MIGWQLFASRHQFFRDLTVPFFGFNRPDAQVSTALQDVFCYQGMLAGLKNVYDCIQQFSESDFTEDLKKVDVPALVIHGDDDQIVPAETTAVAAARLLKNATLKLYPGGSHGLLSTNKDQINQDLLAFLRS